MFWEEHFCTLYRVYPLFNSIFFKQNMKSVAEKSAPYRVLPLWAYSTIHYIEVSLYRSTFGHFVHFSLTSEQSLRKCIFLPKTR